MADITTNPIINYDPNATNQVTTVSPWTSYNQPSYGTTSYIGITPPTPGTTGISGSPALAGYNSLIDPQTGLLKGGLSYSAPLLNPGALQGYQDYANLAQGTGLTQYGQAAQDALDLQAALEQDRVTSQSAAMDRQAREQLAMRGGSSSGARASLGRESIKQGMLGRQGVRQGQLQGTTDIALQSAKAREDALPGLLGLQQDFATANQKAIESANQFNILGALTDIQAGRDWAKYVGEEEGKRWASYNKFLDLYNESGGSND